MRTAGELLCDLFPRKDFGQKHIGFTTCTRAITEVAFIFCYQSVVQLHTLNVYPAIFSDSQHDLAILQNQGFPKPILIVFDEPLLSAALLIHIISELAIRKNDITWCTVEGVNEWLLLLVFIFTECNGLNGVHGFWEAQEIDEREKELQCLFLKEVHSESCERKEDH